MKREIRYILLLALGVLAGACGHREGEVVESAYMLPLPPEPEYRFVRNGRSSVDIQECKLLSTPIDYLYARYLHSALLLDKKSYTHTKQLFAEGEFGLKPRSELAGSTYAAPIRGEVQKYMDDLIEASARLSGYGTAAPYDHRRQEAVVGKGGYVGMSIGDKNISFVDEKGLVVSELFRFGVMGAIYLDKILNVHLDDALLANASLHTEHESLTLGTGHNYTALEHHWDLAYGYYGYWRPWAEGEGIPALRKSSNRIFRAFVEGRMLMETFRYDEVREQARIIREELGRVVVIRAIHALVGANTMTNLREQPKYAFQLLSQGYGLIYAVQFVCKADGTPLLKHEEVQRALESMRSDKGLWDKEKLLDSAAREGSLLWIATKLASSIGVTLDEIKK